MAQKFYDFQADTLGNVPSYITLRRSSVAADYQIAADGSAKFLRYLSATGSSAKAASYTEALSAGVTEIYAEIRDISNSTPASARLLLFASDSPDSEYGAHFDAGYATNGRIVVYRRVGGTFTELATSAFELAGFKGAIYKALLQVTPGSPNQIKAKFWLDGSPEPPTWKIETTDSSRTLSGGWSGHVGFAQDREVRYRAVGIGNNGDPAPRSAIAPVAVTVTINAQETGSDTTRVTLSTATKASIAGQESGSDTTSIQLGAASSVIINAQELGSDTTTVTLSTASELSISAQELGQDVTSISIQTDNSVTLSISAQEMGQDTASVILSTSAIFSIVAQEIGQDLTSINLSVSDAVFVAIEAQEVGQDTASVSIMTTLSVSIDAQEVGQDVTLITLVSGDFYTIPPGCVSISAASPIYRVEEVTCKLT